MFLINLIVKFRVSPTSTVLDFSLDKRQTVVMTTVSNLTIFLKKVPYFREKIIFDKNR